MMTNKVALTNLFVNAFSPEFRSIRFRIPRPFTRPKGLLACGQSPPAQSGRAMPHGRAIVDLPAVLSLFHGFPSEQNPDSKDPGPNSSHEEFNWRTVTPSLKMKTANLG
jgi:hypothetical protein